ncbi:MAG: hypothetical protein QM760_20605 [Nibricoccus sp.]
MFTDSPFAQALRRILAAGAVALVLTLTILAASPEAHEHVHHDCHNDEDHSCAVVLFSQGLWTTFDVVEVIAPSPTWSDHLPVSRPELRLVAPRYLRQPERGPPVS